VSASKSPQRHNPDHSRTRNSAIDTFKCPTLALSRHAGDDYLQDMVVSKYASHNRVPPMIMGRGFRLYFHCLKDWNGFKINTRIHQHLQASPVSGRCIKQGRYPREFNHFTSGIRVEECPSYSFAFASRDWRHKAASKVQ
jgi:hypothetical protein